MRRDLHQVTWTIIVAVVLTNLALVVISTSLHPFRPLRGLAGGPLLPVALMVVIDFLIVIAGLMLVAGGLRLADLGMTRHNAARAVAFTVALWCALHVVLASFQLLEGRSLVLATWLTEAPLATNGRAFYDIVGTALYEELVFRGFLLQQLWLKFSRSDGRGRVASFLAALIVSQAVFALGHIPHLLSADVPLGELPTDMFFLFLWGVLFSLSFVMGGHILFNVGLHALFLAPLTLIELQEPRIVILIMLVVLWGAIMMTRAWLQRRRRRGAAL